MCVRVLCLFTVFEYLCLCIVNVELCWACWRGSIRVFAICGVAISVCCLKHSCVLV